MATRPSYQPHEPHTWWGRRAAPQRLQRLSDGAPRVHADARRLRLLAFEVFFFGTAMSGPELVRVRDTPAGARTQALELIRTGLV